MKLIAQQNIKHDMTVYSKGEMLEVSESQGKRLVILKVAIQVVEPKAPIVKETKAPEPPKDSKDSKDSKDDEPDAPADGTDSKDDDSNESDAGEEGETDVADGKDDEGDEDQKPAYPEGEPTRKWLIDQLRAYATEKGVEFEKTDNKSIILKKLEE